MRKILTPVFVPLTAVAIVLAVALLPGTSTQRKGQIMNQQATASSSSKPTLTDLSITVTYDNNPYKEGLDTAWGFSALLTGLEKNILFDTGGNIRKLAIDPNIIEIIILSHIHGDHTGGLHSLLEKNPNVTVYLLKAFPEKFKDNVRASGAKMVEVVQPLKICKNVYSTGQLGTWVKEQSLIIQADKGLIVITGCAHPGIVKTLTTAKDFLNDDILLVMGGFHLEWATAGKIEEIISTFEKLNVCYVGPCHCSGDKARRLFEKHFGKNYMNVGVGKVITIADL